MGAACSSQKPLKSEVKKIKTMKILERNQKSFHHQISEQQKDILTQRISHDDESKHEKQIVNDLRKVLLKEQKQIKEKSYDFIKETINKVNFTDYLEHDDMQPFHPSTYILIYSSKSDDLIRQMIQVTISPGEWLFKEGAKGNSFFLIGIRQLPQQLTLSKERGQIEVCICDPPQPCRTLQRGDTFGERALLFNKLRTSGIRGAGSRDVILWRLDYSSCGNHLNQGNVKRFSEIYKVFNQMEIQKYFSKNLIQYLTQAAVLVDQKEYEKKPLLQRSTICSTTTKADSIYISKRGKFQLTTPTNNQKTSFLPFESFGELELYEQTCYTQDLKCRTRGHDNESQRFELLKLTKESLVKLEEKYNIPVIVKLAFYNRLNYCIGQDEVIQIEIKKRVEYMKNEEKKQERIREYEIRIIKAFQFVRLESYETTKEDIIHKGSSCFQAAYFIFDGNLAKVIYSSFDWQLLKRKIQNQILGRLSTFSGAQIISKSKNVLKGLTKVSQYQRKAILAF